MRFHGGTNVQDNVATKITSRIRVVIIILIVVQYSAIEGGAWGGAVGCKDEECGRAARDDNC